jgi:hypothetical protein
MWRAESRYTRPLSPIHFVMVTVCSGANGSTSLSLLISARSPLPVSRQRLTIGPRELLRPPSAVQQWRAMCTQPDLRSAPQQSVRPRFIHRTPLHSA